MLLAAGMTAAHQFPAAFPVPHWTSGMAARHYAWETQRLSCVLLSCALLVKPQSDPVSAGVAGKYTVPVFWDKKTKTIVNNECVLLPARAR